MKKGFRVVLASGSPRRREILDRSGIAHEVMVSSCSEETDETEPAAYVKELALRKALDVKNRAGADALVLAADTVVALDDEILGKPADETDAENMLKSLSGRFHEVYSGVAILFPNGEKEVFSNCTRVYVRPLTKEQIKEYIDTKEPMDKAGAYGIQGGFGLYIERIDGDYLNVVGLPVSELYARALARGYDLRHQK